MLTDNGLEVDFERLEEVLRTGDVVTIGFTLFPERILVDTRSSAEQGPLTTVAPPVATVQERYLWLGKHRGAFGAPKAFSFFVWPQTVRSLVENDVLATLRGRLVASGGEAAAEDFDASLAEALQLERDTFRAAIRGGEPWTTVWAASGSATG